MAQTHWIPRADPQVTTEADTRNEEAILSIYAGQHVKGEMSIAARSLANSVNLSTSTEPFINTSITALCRYTSIEPMAIDYLLETSWLATSWFRTTSMTKHGRDAFFAYVEYQERSYLLAGRAIGLDDVGMKNAYDPSSIKFRKFDCEDPARVILEIGAWRMQRHECIVYAAIASRCYARGSYNLDHGDWRTRKPAFLRYDPLMKGGPCSVLLFLRGCSGSWKNGIIS